MSTDIEEKSTPSASTGQYRLTTKEGGDNKIEYIGGDIVQSLPPEIRSHLTYVQPTPKGAYGFAYLTRDEVISYYNTGKTGISSEEQFAINKQTEAEAYTRTQLPSVPLTAKETPEAKEYQSTLEELVKERGALAYRKNYSPLIGFTGFPAQADQIAIRHMIDIQTESAKADVTLAKLKSYEDVFKTYDPEFAVKLEPFNIPEYSAGPQASSVSYSIDNDARRSGFYSGSTVTGFADKDAVTLGLKPEQAKTQSFDAFTYAKDLAQQAGVGTPNYKAPPAGSPEEKLISAYVSGSLTANPQQYVQDYFSKNYTINPPDTPQKPTMDITGTLAGTKPTGEAKPIDPVAELQKQYQTSGVIYDSKGNIISAPDFGESAMKSKSSQQVLESLAPSQTKYDDVKFAQEYEASKGLTLQGIRTGEPSQYPPLEISEEQLSKTNALRNSLGLEPLQNVIPLSVWKVAPVTIARNIVTEAKSKGATRINIYDIKGNPIGNLPVKTAESALEDLVRYDKFKYGFVLPLNANVLPEYSDIVSDYSGLQREITRTQAAEFKTYVTELEKGGATIYIFDKSGNKIGTTTGGRSYHDVIQAQSEQTKKGLGDIQLEARYSYDTVIKSMFKTPEPTGTAEVGYGIAKVSVPAIIVSEAKTISDTIKNVGVGLGVFLATPYVATYDYLTKGTLPGGSPPFAGGSVMSPKTPEILEKTIGQYGGQTALSNLITPTPYKLPFSAVVTSLATEGLIYALLSKNIFAKGQAKAPPKIALETQIKIETPTMASGEYVYRIRPTNPYRTPIPKDIFELDTAQTPTGSLREPTPRNTILEDITKETQGKLSQNQAKLLEPIANKLKVEEPPLPEELNPLGYRGRPPVTREATIDDLLQKSRAQVVEETRPLPEHEVFKPSGEKIEGLFGNIEKPKGALLEIEKPRPVEPLLPEELNPLGYRGRPPVTRETPIENILTRAKAVESTRPMPFHEVFKATGEQRLGTFGDIPEPLGALGKITEVKPKPDASVQLSKGYKPRKLGQYTFAEDYADLAERMSTKPEMEFKGQEKVIALTKARLIKIQNSLLKEVRKGKLKQPVPEPGDIKEFYTKYGKEGRRAGKIDTNKLLAGETPIEDLATRKPPLKTNYPKDFNEFREFQTRIEREQELGIFTKEEGIGALGKAEKVQSPLTEAKPYEPDVREFVTRLPRTKPPKKGGKIDNEKLLGIEEPSIGAPKEFEQAIPRELTREQRKNLRARQWSKAKTPTWKVEEAKQEFKPTGKEMPTKTGQVLVQETKKETKTTEKPKTTQRKARPIVAGLSEYETVYLHPERPQPATAKSQQERRLFAGLSTSLITGLTQKVAQLEKLGTKQITKQLPKQATSSRTSVKQIPKQIIRVEQVPRQAQKPKQVQLLTRPTPEKGVPRLTPALTPAEIPKQTTTTTPEPVIPLKQKTIIPFGLPPPSIKKPYKIKRKFKPRANFLGNVPVTEVVGIYRKRPDITYGMARTAKLVRQDVSKFSKGNVVKGFYKSQIQPRKPSLFTKPKVKRRSTRFSF